MKALRIASWVGLPLVILLALPARAAPTPSDRVNELVGQLADPDAEARRQAAMELVRLGMDARPALLNASRSDNPAISAAAASTLMALPWHRSGDPAPVTSALARYGSQDEAGRIAIVSQLAELSGGLGIPALLRLVVEDPSEDVCWMIAMQIRARRDMRVDELIRGMAALPEKPAALVLAARGWMWTDRLRALNLLEQALNAESQRRTYDTGELDYAFDRLCAAALAANQLDRCAELRRWQAERVGVSRDWFPAPVYELFALHAKFGPLAGYEADLRQFAPYIGDPQVLYALAWLKARTGHRAESFAMECAAASAGVSAAQRLLVARFLEAQNWIDWARREAYAALAAEGAGSINVRYGSLMLLLTIATAEEIDAAGVAHLTTTTRMLDELEGRRRAPGASLYEANAMAAELAWRQARIAHAQGDAAAARTHLMRLVDTDPTDSEVVLNAYALLKRYELGDAAEKLYQRSYEEASLKQAQDPQNPQLMNQLAWLSANCSRDLDRALAMAERAVATEPDNPAYIDTLAEVHFRRSNAAEAARLESRALVLDPDDAFMLRQLRRFRAAMQPEH